MKVRPSIASCRRFPVADRISNMISLGFVTNAGFIERYTEETERYIYPLSEEVNPAMHRELVSLVTSRRAFLNNCTFG